MFVRTNTAGPVAVVTEFAVAEVAADGVDTNSVDITSAVVVSTFVNICRAQITQNIL